MSVKNLPAFLALCSLVAICLIGAIWLMSLGKAPENGWGWLLFVGYLIAPPLNGKSEN